VVCNDKERTVQLFDKLISPFPICADDLLRVVDDLTIIQFYFKSNSGHIQIGLPLPPIGIAPAPPLQLT
jgi:hypothetical protein